MQVYNTTEDVISQRYLKFDYIVGPEEIKSVADDCGDHLIRNKSNYGLVKLDYGIKEEEQYGSLKNYKLVKKIEGLKKYKAWTKHCIDQESMFKREVTQKNGGEVEMSATQVPTFEKRLKRIDTLISDAEKEYDQFLISKKSEVKKDVEQIPIKKGRPFQKREVINVDSATA